MRKLLAVLTLLAAPALAQNSTSGNTVRDPGSGGSSGASLSVANTWTEDQTFELGNFACFGTDGGCIGETSPSTPDATFLATRVANAWIIAEKDDTGFDFAHPLQVNPTLFIHSNVQNTTQWISLTHDATNGVIDVGVGKLNVLDSIVMSGTDIQLAPGGGLTMSASGYLDWGATIGQTFGMAALTPDAFVISTGSASNSVQIMERADTGFDFQALGNTTALTNPTLILRSAAQNTTNYLGLAYYGNAGKAVKALTEAAATSLVRIPITTLTGTGGTVTFTVLAANATDAATLSGVFAFTAVNVAATETCPTPTLVGTAIGAESTATQTPICTFVCDTSPANAVDLQMNCTTTMVQTTLDAYWRINMTGPGEPLPQ